MGQRKTPGLQLKRGIWQIDKKIRGNRICESTGTTSRREAELILAKRIDEVRKVIVFGERCKRIFRDAVTRYLSSEDFLKLRPTTKEDYIDTLEILDKYIGDSPLERVTMESLEQYKQDRMLQGALVQTSSGPKKIRSLSNRTINKGYERVRQILCLATQWRDENNLPWLDRTPKITMLSIQETQKPSRPLSWSEQDALFSTLPIHLQDCALFLVNTGIRESNVRRLCWEWEIKLKDGKSIFVIPKQYVKNKHPRIVVLNSIAQSVIERQRGLHPTYVFTYEGNPIKSRLSNTSWNKARQKAGLGGVRVHDLKHTFGQRLRAAGVSFEDRQDLLGHKSNRITTHYSMAKIEQLVDAANKVINRNEFDELSISIQEVLAKASTRE